MVPHTGNPNTLASMKPAGTAENIRFRSDGIDHSLSTSATEEYAIP